MNISNLQLDQERRLHEKLLITLHSKAVLPLLMNQTYKTDKNNSYHEKKLHKSALEICEKIQNIYEYETEINLVFYSGSKNDMFSKLHNNKNTTIHISVNLIRNLSEIELEFLLGREIAKIYFESENIDRLITFFYKDKQPNILISNYLSKWKILNTLTLDRCASIVCSDLTKIQDMKHILEISNSSEEHQFNYTQNLPLKQRLNILEEFTESKYFLKQNFNLQYKSQGLHELFPQEITEELRYLLVFIVSAGIIISRQDNIVTIDETNKIHDWLAKYLISIPEQFIERFQECQQIDRVLEISLRNILRINPDYKDTLLEYMIEIAMIDNDLAHNETEFIKEIGKKYMELEENYICGKMLQIASQKLSPDLTQLIY